MANITVDLIRKRSEHNEGVISTLEEISLHQEDIAKIDTIQNICRDLRILYLQSNLISKIENLGRLKKLEYLNLALNNVERVENLEGCESLEKLDLTLNFIGEITSITSLSKNIHLKSLFLTGNPCAEFKGYREYVIASLPQLECLDSIPIERSHRIQAYQKYEEIFQLILEEEKKYKEKRKRERDFKESAKNNCDSTAFDDPESIKRYWDEMSDNSPETRIEMAKQSRRQREMKEKQRTGIDEDCPRKVYKLFRQDGSPLSVNEPKIPFMLNEDEENNRLVLTIEVYKYLDTSFIDADVQPTYVQVKIKGKVFQLVLPAEVHPDKSNAQRSQITGHLVISMPMVLEKTGKKTMLPKIEKRESQVIPAPTLHDKKRELLEIGPADDSMDFSKIIEIGSRHSKMTSSAEKELSCNFKDDQEVPPLE